MPPVAEQLAPYDLSTDTSVLTLMVIMTHEAPVAIMTAGLCSLLPAYTLLATAHTSLDIEHFRAGPDGCYDSGHKAV